MNLINSFAVVSYIENPIANLVERVRHELMPSSPFRPHITVLPPRPLYVSTRNAIEQCRDLAGKFEAFEVKLGSVDLFEDTQVIKVSIEQGFTELKTLHDALNSGSFEHVEDFEYVPHVTLARELSFEKVALCLDLARRRWAEFGPLSTIRLGRLTLVQQSREGSWHNLAQLQLSSSKPAGVDR